MSEEGCRNDASPRAACQLYVADKMSEIKDLIAKNHLETSMAVKMLQQSVDEQHKQLKPMLGNGQMGFVQMRSEWTDHKEDHDKVSDRGWKTIGAVLLVVCNLLFAGLAAKMGLSQAQIKAALDATNAAVKPVMEQSVVP